MCSQPCLDPVGVQASDGPLRLVAPALGALAGLARVHDPDRVWELGAVSDHEPATRGWAFCLALVPGQALAHAVVPADPPAIPHAMRVFAVVHAEDFLLELVLLVLEHVGHQQLLQVGLAFALALIFHDLLLDNLLVHRSAMCGDVLRALVPAVELRSSFAAGDVNDAALRALVVLLVVRDDAKGIFQILSGQGLFLVVIVIGQVSERTGTTWYAEVEPHAHQLDRCVTLHEDTEAAEEGLDADGGGGLDLQELERHGNLHNARPLNTLREHLLHELLFDLEPLLQDRQARADT
mmetsp:Transcript_121407/g.354895  ORF Transcript_121407/g.354895 Transcript_121407/m.354895 type:complete len:294 (-) Transcript_121407:146-1027(-)